MNKKVLTMVAVLSVFTLFGCNNRNDSSALGAPQVASLKPMQQSYRGTLPCADCEGIETSLFLEASGSWVMNQHYLGKNVSLATYGQWARTADRLVLTQSNGEKHYYLPKDDSLVMLNKQGNPIHSAMNYSLKAVDLELPVTPMTMKGEYSYLADAAIFKDCASGKVYPVDSDAKLQEYYLSVRDKHTLPVLLQFDAHFTRQPAPDSDTFQNVLVSDGKAEFFPGKTCQR
ncbi:envelope stress response activation lipoprotein NlpE [Citrobacter sp. JGM124]|uniref:envelope stress response activation lipoprotein NlpE n=1 Tax=Citrobacter sp. JGM124 TaxID=2799789 RepID=UPI001BA9F18D|nr:envelope stress response activation lipoprotein NlpE [Citrobacter sp. JGM124]MBS0848564.1 envelope stress response activation lipoprotein NlpE [Citrobacter sp. JGM124]